MVDRGKPVVAFDHRGFIAQSVVVLGGRPQYLEPIEHGIESLGQLHIWRFGLGPIVQHRELERAVGRADPFPQHPAPVQLRPDRLGVAFRPSLVRGRACGPACKGPERENGCG